MILVTLISDPGHTLSLTSLDIPLTKALAPDEEQRDGEFCPRFGRVYAAGAGAGDHIDIGQQVPTLSWSLSLPPCPSCPRLCIQARGRDHTVKLQ